MSVLSVSTKAQSSVRNSMLLVLIEVDDVPFVPPEFVAVLIEVEAANFGSRTVFDAVVVVVLILVVLLCNILETIVDVVAISSSFSSEHFFFDHLQPSLRLHSPLVFSESQVVTGDVVLVNAEEVVVITVVSSATVVVVISARACRSPAFFNRSIALADL